MSENDLLEEMLSIKKDRKKLKIKRMELKKKLDSLEAMLADVMLSGGPSGRPIEVSANYVSTYKNPRGYEESGD